MGAFTVLKFRLFLAIATGFINLALIFVVVGMVTNFWLEIRDSNVYKDDVEMHFGLHRVCWSKSDRCNNPLTNYDKSNYLPKIQGLVIAGGIFGLFASLVALAHFFRELLECRLRITTIATVVLAILSGLFLMIGCAMFGEKVEISKGYSTMFDRYTYLSYSFGLTTCAGAMMWVGAILVALASFCGKREEDPGYPAPPPYSVAASRAASAPSYAQSYAPSYISGRN